MIQKIHIDQIFFNTKNKEGKPYTDRRNNPFTMVVVKWEGKQASGIAYAGDEMLQWMQGQTVEAVLEQNGQYLNIKKPSKLDLLEARVKALEERLELRNLRNY